MTKVQAIWNGQLLAESDQTLRMEGNHYFPKDSVDMHYFQESDQHTLCPWKGVASYYDVVVDGETNRAAAWYYPEPSEAASSIRGRIAFWKGVQVVSSDE